MIGFLVCRFLYRWVIILTGPGDHFDHPLLIILITPRHVPLIILRRLHMRDRLGNGATRGAREVEAHDVALFGSTGGRVPREQHSEARAPGIATGVDKSLGGAARDRPAHGGLGQAGACRPHASVPVVRDAVDELGERIGPGALAPVDRVREQPPDEDDL